MSNELKNLIAFTKQLSALDEFSAMNHAETIVMRFLKEDNRCPIARKIATEASSAGVMWYSLRDQIARLA